MTSKDRVRMAINHEEPDKVPLDSWIAPEVSDQLSGLQSPYLGDEDVRVVFVVELRRVFGHVVAGGEKHPRPRLQGDRVIEQVLDHGIGGRARCPWSRSCSST